MYKKGHWIQIDDTKCKCSCCDIIAFIALYPSGDKNFCPNCGAIMNENFYNKFINLYKKQKDFSKDELETYEKALKINSIDTGFNIFNFMRSNDD